MQGEMGSVLRLVSHVVCLVILGGIHTVKQLLVPAATDSVSHLPPAATMVGQLRCRSRDSLGLQLRSLQLERRRDVARFH
jgi:hypothetical protein